MSQAPLRQSELFAGNDWTAIYRAFTEVDLSSYDFDSIRSAMTDYIRRNYPEDYNDWIESSEFVALIDLMSYLGQSLAFRLNLEARENFFDTARNRNSVLRLARFVNYNATRNYPARGIVKLSSIQTSQDVYDSSGNNLNNIQINWNDPNNSNWYEQWMLVLNASLVNTNPFGQPLKSLEINSITTQLYQFNNIPTGPGNFPFTCFVDNTSTSFDICNVDFNTQQGFFEKDPNIQGAVNIVYQNDGNGNSSANTGFFFYFKQGVLQKSDYTISDPVENLLIPLTATGINELDFWVQSVDDSGNLLSGGTWTRVGYVPDEDTTKLILNTDNVTYNSVTPTITNLYQTITQANDAVTVRFGDGRFATIPTNNLRIWYRTSNGESYTINPEDISDVQIVIPYTANNNTQQSITLTFDLQYSVSNSTPAETNDDIRRRAGQVYATQGRMVNGQDYNTFPLTINLADKIKAVNRIYSGQSRYIDLNDPTGTYQNTKVFSNDGAFYRQFYNQYLEVPFSLNYSAQQQVSVNISPAITNVMLRDFLYNQWLGGTATNAAYNFEYIGTYLWWNDSTNSVYTSSGCFAKSSTQPTSAAEYTSLAALLGSSAASGTIEQYIVPGTLLKFANAGWVMVVSVQGNGAGFLSSGQGDVILNQNVSTGDQVLEILPVFRQTLISGEISAITTAFGNNRTFGIGFDFISQSWYVIDSTTINTTNPYSYSSKGTSSDSSWLVLATYTTLSWQITTRGLRYIFESDADVKFYFTSGQTVIDPTTGLPAEDQIVIGQTNVNPQILGAKPWQPLTVYTVGSIVSVQNFLTTSKSPTWYECVYAHTSGNVFQAGTVDNGAYQEVWVPVSPMLNAAQTLAVANPILFSDGYADPARVQVISFANFTDNQPNNPDIFENVVDTSTWIFQQQQTDANGYIYYSFIDPLTSWADTASPPVCQPDEIVFVYNVASESGTFYECLLPVAGIPDINKPTQLMPLANQMQYQAFIGRRNINFEWDHVAASDHRIDPSVSNIIDIFVLTTTYNNAMITWRAGTNPTVETMPTPDTESDLINGFSSIESYAMFSDEIIWRPVNFKLLFGVGAPAETAARFKVVVLPGTALTDGEIQSGVITAINNFFNVNNWDFGETFYASELLAYIHRQMVTSISSVVLVPQAANSAFGDLFEIRCDPDQLFFPTATVNYVDIISANTTTSLRIS